MACSAKGLSRKPGADPAPTACQVGDDPPSAAIFAPGPLGAILANVPLVLRDDLFLAHDPGPEHPESPERLSAIYRDLDASPPAGVVTVHPAAAQQVDLERI